VPEGVLGFLPVAEPLAESIGFGTTTGGTPGMVSLGDAGVWWFDPDAVAAAPAADGIAASNMPAPIAAQVRREMNMSPTPHRVAGSRDRIADLPYASGV
jgi:hypothetical protein